MDDADDWGNDPQHSNGDGEHHEEWIRLGHGVWLIRHTDPDGAAYALWAVEQDAGDLSDRWYDVAGSASPGGGQGGAVPDFGQQKARRW
jgi:hypothetical protein